MMLGELNDEAIRALLARLHIGHLGVWGDDRVFVFPVAYGFDGEDLYIQSHEGLKLRLMRKHPEVCLEVEDIEGPSRWQSAMVYGRFEELTGETERDRAFAVINAQGDVRAPDSIAPYIGGPEQLVVYRLRVTEMTGRFEGSYRA
jgi:nitroimidazol reductase NimA-like FMN-containing flavoprotein (pyridoxamine 5'-phosphate oxidase superfamily)